MGAQYLISIILICLSYSNLCAQVIVSFAITDTVHPIPLRFTNGITSDSVFYCNCTHGSFVVPDVNYCPTLTLNTKSVRYGNDFLYISLDNPVTQLHISIEDSLPILRFDSDTFNQYYYEYASALRPLKWHQRQLNKAMRDKTKNIDSLYAVWIQSLNDFNSLQYNFYTQHGHQSRARLLYAYSKLASMSMSKDSIRTVFDGMRGYADNMKQYGYCIKMLNDSSYTITPGKRMPEMSFLNLDEVQLKSTDFQNANVNYFFWATWCHGCKPELETLRSNHSNSNWVIVNVDKDYHRWKAYVRDKEFLKETYYYKFGDTDENLFRLGVNYLPYIIETERGEVVRKGARIEEVLRLDK